MQILQKRTKNNKIMRYDYISHPSDKQKVSVKTENAKLRRYNFRIFRFQTHKEKEN